MMLYLVGGKNTFFWKVYGFILPAVLYEFLYFVSTLKAAWEKERENVSLEWTYELNAYIGKSSFANTQSHRIYHDLYLPDIGGNHLNNLASRSDLNYL